MGTPYVGEIRMVGFNFAPVGWALCDGQALNIAQNDALFALIGTTYGGDGQETFHLPNLQSRIPVHAGTGPDGTVYTLGQADGVETVTLTVQQLPAHTHVPVAQSEAGNQPGPQEGVWALSDLTQFNDKPPGPAMAPEAILPTGGSQPHENLMPYTVINFIIALQGVFPTQS
jgi:microcystin-dependent protein